MIVHFKAFLKLFFTVVVIAGILVFLFSVTISIILANMALHRPEHGWPKPGQTGSRVRFADKITKDETWFIAQKPEEIHLVSYDGLKLFARFLPTGNPETAKGAVILMHGYHSNALYDFAGIYNYFHKEGYNVLLCDQRAHGNSEGTYLTFGIRERYDCRSWINYLYSRFGESQKIWLMGVSMGSSTVLMTAGFNLPSNVKGIIADCGFTSPYAIMETVLARNYHLPPKLILPVADIITRVTAGFSLKEYSTIEALKTNKIPVLFVHGDKDTFVPIQMSERNYADCIAPKSFLRTHADHAASFFTDKENYEQALHKFMN